MGIVYKAHDRTLDETVAIRVLRALFHDPSLAQRFIAEIKLARRVTHKNVCRIHDYGEAGSVRFISMQWVDGVELRQMIRRAGSAAARVTRLGCNWWMDSRPSIIRASFIAI
jgi:eukaryotic-like serine/threonine-protein kinase